ncbi:MAG: pyruvate formate lyase-activating protein [Clostridia bacterium]|nr:pyruvate formate lyase-activating protein [Clostridia bacterium]
MKSGRIRSVETMGLVDGPGIRTVIFLQGCHLRCKFCHNPESWAVNGGEEVDAETLFQKILRFRPYFERSGGGVTFSGGEPLLQPEFLLEMLKRCKTEGIHTCIDTAGVGLGQYDEILRYTDLVLYDVKALTEETYKTLCGRSIEETERFQEALRKAGTKTIVRQVVIPGWNDQDEYMAALKQYIESNIPTAISVELLPYHLLGVHKYKTLGLPEPMPGTEAMDKERVKELYQKYFTPTTMKEEE